MGGEAEGSRQAAVGAPAAEIGRQHRQVVLQAGGQLNGTRLPPPPYPAIGVAR